MKRLLIWSSACEDLRQDMVWKHGEYLTSLETVSKRPPAHPYIDDFLQGNDAPTMTSDFATDRTAHVTMRRDVEQNLPADREPAK